MAYIGREPTNTGEFLLLDNVSGSFNGSTTGFTLTVGTSKVTPAKENTIIALDGVLQTSGDAYTISGSTLNFTEAPAAGTTFYGILAGQSQYISNSSINNDHISGTANISGSKINTDFSAQSLQLTHVTASGNISASGNLYGTVATPAQTSITSVGTIGTGVWNSTFGATANTLVSGSFTTVSSSLASKVTTLEGTGTTQGVGTTNSPTFADVTATGTVTAQEFHTEFVSSSIMYTSGSTRFGNTSDDIHQFTGSIHLTNSGSVSGSSDSTGSFGRVEGTVDFGDIVIDDDEIPIAKLVSDAVTVTAGDGLKTGGSVTLGSSVTLDVDVSDFAGTGLTDEGSENLAVDFSDSTLQTTISGSFTAASSSLASRITSDSGSFSTRITTAESELGNTLISGSAQIANDISGSFLAVSSSLATRVTTEEANVDTLQSTMTSEQTNIDNLQTDSGSFSTRVTKNEATGSSLTTASSSFSTRVTTNEGKATKGFTIAMSVAL